MLKIGAQAVVTAFIAVLPAAHGVLVISTASLIKLVGQAEITVGAIGEVAVRSHRGEQDGQNCDKCSVSQSSYRT